MGYCRICNRKSRGAPEYTVVSCPCAIIASGSELLFAQPTVYYEFFKTVYPYQIFNAQEDSPFFFCEPCAKGGWLEQKLSDVLCPLCAEPITRISPVRDFWSVPYCDPNNKEQEPLCEKFPKLELDQMDCIRRIYKQSFSSLLADDESGTALEKMCVLMCQELDTKLISTMYGAPNQHLPFIQKFSTK